MNKCWFVGIAMLTLVGSTDAWPHQALQEFDTARQFERALAAVDAIKARKKLHCVLAIASRPLCDCLTRKLPVDTYPRSYASIAAQENEYEVLSISDKKIVSQCVSENR
jgi:hypothetical protein